MGVLARIVTDGEEKSKHAEKSIMSVTTRLDQVQQTIGGHARELQELTCRYESSSREMSRVQHIIGDLQSLETPRSSPSLWCRVPDSADSASDMLVLPATSSAVTGPAAGPALKVVRGRGHQMSFMK